MRGSNWEVRKGISEEIIFKTRRIINCQPGKRGREWEGGTFQAEKLARMCKNWEQKITSSNRIAGTY